MDFLIGAVTGSIATLITSVIIYQSHINKLILQHAWQIAILRRIIYEYNR